MTQVFKIATIAPTNESDEADVVQRMGLAVVRQWGALPTEVKHLLRDQAVAVDLGDGQRTDVEGRVDAFLQYKPTK